jgi:glycerol-3-phosphate O-acyltransferase / dihydroxyacetone phosphate acyltransferase
VWLLPAFSHLARFAVRTFYRLEVSGERVPRRGPVLLAANHPNSLMDPAVVAAVAGRPVRFLAKAPLFRDPLVGWLVRGSGAIPVHRHQDDPAQMERNDETFRAVHRALAAASVVGIFPEGISHDAPSLAPLRTGAARMALGGAALAGGAFPVVPVGLVFRDKTRFRSEALAVVGAPVPWDDLAGRGEHDADAVRELTARIDRALHAVTVNLERWQDAPLVETAEAVFTAELGADPSPAARIARLRGATTALARLRRERPGEWEPLARQVRAHARTLRLLGMTPAQAKAEVGLAEAGTWTLRQLGVPRMLLPVAALGVALFFVPYRLTALAVERAAPVPGLRATYKALLGGVLHLAWILLLAGAAGLVGGWRWGLGALLVLPATALVTVAVLGLWQRAAGEARRFLLRRTRADALREVRARQRALAERLREVWEEVRT